MSQYQIVSICQRDINIINCAQEGASFITKQRAVEKKSVYLMQHQGHTNKMDSEHLKNYVQIYTHKSDLFLCSCDN